MIIVNTVFDNYIMDVFLFIATILSMIATAAIVCIMCKHENLKALLTGIAFQPIRETILQMCHTIQYTIAALISRIIGLIIFILVTTRTCRIFRGKLFSNTVTVMLFFSDVKQYVLVKLC